jgi:hypothetical protein
MNLKSISNNKLISDLKLKVENERKLLMEILYSLREVEIRNLHLELGYPSLYEFAMKELGYSAGAAHRRITAMRLLQSVPELAPKLESGELGLENASQAQVFFRKEDQRRKASGELKLTLTEMREVITELLGKSTREGQRVLTEKSPEVMTPSETLRPLPDHKTLVQFVASSELMNKLEELKHLMAHQNYEGRMDILVDQIADIALAQFKPKVRPSRSATLSKERSHESVSRPLANASPHPTPQATNATPPPGKAQSAQKIKVSSNSLSTPQAEPANSKTNLTNSGANLTKAESNLKKRSRYIPVQEKRKVLLRDQKGCTYKDPKTGRVCHSKHGLQYEHIQPFSLGGKNSAENLTLLCGTHNRYRAQQMGLWK